MTTTVSPHPTSGVAPTDRGSWRAASLDGLVPTLCVVTTLVIVANVMAMLGRGFEFTDGGYAWNLAVDPSSTPLVVTQAGRVEHVLFGLLGHDEILFQRVNAALSLVLATLLAAVVLRVRRPASTGARWRHAALAIGLGASAFTMLAQWQAPPNYKWLAIQGLLLATIGLLARPADRPRGEFALGVTLGVGGWVTFLAKPVSAIVLAIVCLAHVALAGPSSRRWTRVAVGAGTATVLVVVVGLAVSESFGGFLVDLRDGASLTAVMDPNHAVGQVLMPDLPSLATTTTLVLVGCTALVATLLWWMHRVTPPAPHPDTAAAHDTGQALWSRHRLVPVLVPCTVAVVAIVVASTTWGWWPDYALSQGTWALALPLGTAAVALAVRGRSTSPTRRGDLADLAVLLVLPSAFAIGTGNNHWHEAGRAAVFWILAALPLFRLGFASGPRRRAMLVVLVVTAQLVTAALVHVGIREPYRQNTPLRAMDVAPASPTVVEGLVLSPAGAEFVDGIVGGARAAGFEPGTGIIDLSGRTPGMLHLLGAEPLGRAWLLGGFPGSIEVATRFLAAEGCPALAAAWVLDGPGGTRSLAPEVATNLGMDLDRDFTVVGTGTAPDGVRRRLLAPRRGGAEGTTACQDALGEFGHEWRADPLDPGTEPAETTGRGPRPGPRPAAWWPDRPAAAP